MEQSWAQTTGVADGPSRMPVLRCGDDILVRSNLRPVPKPFCSSNVAADNNVRAPVVVPRCAPGQRTITNSLANRPA